LIADPINSSVYWSGGEYDAMAVSKTTNSGATWTRHTLAPAGYTYALAADPSNPNIVYAGGNPGIYKTTNSGNNWSAASIGLSGYVYDIAIDISNTSILYAGTPDGVFKSTNSGVNWSNTGCVGVNAVLIDPDAPNIIYAGTNSGVYKSTTSGGNWTAMNDGLGDTLVTSLGINPGYYLFAGTKEASMYRWTIQVGLAESDKILDRESIFFAAPNPTKDKTTIHYSISKATQVNVAIYDVQGRVVCELISELHEPGKHHVTWDGLDAQGRTVSSGIFFCKLATDNSTSIHKLILIK
jgi:hypothetical protein